MPKFKKDQIVYSIPVFPASKPGLYTATILEVNDDKTYTIKSNTTKQVKADVPFEQVDKRYSATRNLAVWQAMKENDELLRAELDVTMANARKRYDAIWAIKQGEAE